jgi:hypothetical protein
VTPARRRLWLLLALGVAGGLVSYYVSRGHALIFVLPLVGIAAGSFGSDRPRRRATPLGVLFGVLVFVAACLVVWFAGFWGFVGVTLAIVAWAFVLTPGRGTPTPV